MRTGYFLDGALRFRQIMTGATDYALVGSVEEGSNIMDDYHAFESTRGGSDGGGGNGGCLPWLIGFLIILWLCSR